MSYDPLFHPVKLKRTNAHRRTRKKKSQYIDVFKAFQIYASLLQINNNSRIFIYLVRIVLYYTSKCSSQLQVDFSYGCEWIQDGFLWENLYLGIPHRLVFRWLMRHSSVLW